MAVALLVAAGRGERLGTGGPKAFVMLGGRPMLQWSIDALRAVDEVDRIVVALPPGAHAPAGTVGVPGGAQRSHSVRAALREAGDAAVVVVHDAARPMVTPEIVQDCLDTLEALGGPDAAGLQPRRARARARPRRRGARGRDRRRVARRVGRRHGPARPRAP